jgi:hypothetical protein
MADQSQFSILTFQRRPGHWRAAINRKDRTAINMGGVMLKSFVTSVDCESEQEAEKSAQKAIRQI